MQYKSRRDFLIDALADEFLLQRSVGTTGSWTGCPVYTAYAKPRAFVEMSEKYRAKPLFSLVPPTSGMFVWLRIHFDENVRGGAPEDGQTQEVKL